MTPFYNHLTPVLLGLKGCFEFTLPDLMRWGLHCVHVEVAKHTLVGVGADGAGLWTTLTVCLRCSICSQMRICAMRQPCWPTFALQSLHCKRSWRDSFDALEKSLVWSGTANPNIWTHLHSSTKTNCKQSVWDIRWGTCCRLNPCKFVWQTNSNNRDTPLWVTIWMTHGLLFIYGWGGATTRR